MFFLTFTLYYLLLRIQDAAIEELARGDPWAKHEIYKIPAERVIRYSFNPESLDVDDSCSFVQPSKSNNSWKAEETIVKVQKEAFTHGAMRHCFRMKMLNLPKGISGIRSNKSGWKRAQNYVAKGYLQQQSSNGDSTAASATQIDTSKEAREAVFNDIILQYEAANWAKKFNDKDPPKKIDFIRAYVLEFPDREGSPCFAIERFISSRDEHGGGFFKHNTNSGFVDDELGRVTPQVFSAYSFYASKGTRLIADIQGVGDLYTDPQVLSNDYRFGDGDLGPRGMALFFHSFRHGSFADKMGIPLFPLSRNERKEHERDIHNNNETTVIEETPLDKFARLDRNRMNRKSMFFGSSEISSSLISTNDAPTERRSNSSSIRNMVSKSMRQSMRNKSLGSSVWQRSHSDTHEVEACLLVSTNEPIFEYNVSGNLPKNVVLGGLRSTTMNTSHRPIMLDDETKENLGKVHYQLACLHGLGRFTEEDQSSSAQSDKVLHHDAFSVLFHLSHAASLRNVSACVALARVRAGLTTTVSFLLHTIVNVDFSDAKELLVRAMESPSNPQGKAAAGCLLYQILEDEKSADITNDNYHAVSIHQIEQIIEDTLQYMEEAIVEKEEMKKNREKELSNESSSSLLLKAGDKVQANWFLEGNFYPAEVVNVKEEENLVIVRYEDDSEESLPMDQVIGDTTTTNNITRIAEGQNLPMTDSEALLGGEENLDEKYLYETYLLQAKLAEIKKCQNNNREEAILLYNKAADGAMNDGKMKWASEWSALASEL